MSYVVLLTPPIDSHKNKTITCQYLYIFVVADKHLIVEVVVFSSDFF